jgi:hypothetical protein
MVVLNLGLGLMIWYYSGVPHGIAPSGRLCMNVGGPFCHLLNLVCKRGYEF